MPSPLNTPTSDQESKSIFDSIENLSQLKTTTTTTTTAMGIDPDITRNNSIYSCNKEFDNDDKSSVKTAETSISVENENLSIPLYKEDDDVISIRKSKNSINHSKLSSTNHHRQQQKQNGSTMSLESTTSLSNSTLCSSSTNLTCSSESNPTNIQTDNENDDTNSSWRNNSIKYRRARLNLNLVPLKNLSLPQISPTPTTDTTFLPVRNGSSCSTGSGHHNDDSGDQNLSSINNGRSRSSANGNHGSDYFNFSFHNHQQHYHSYQSCSHHHHHQHHQHQQYYSSSSSSSTSTGYICPTTTAILIKRPPSPKYNPSKFEPIVQLSNYQSSQMNDTSNNNNNYIDRNINSRWCLNSQDHNNNISNRLSSSSSVLNGKQQQQLRFNYQDAIRIDPNVDLEHQFWFHGSINQKDSERILAKHKIGSYLVRRWNNIYTLSLKSIFGYIHFRLFHCHHNGHHWSLGHVECSKIATLNKQQHDHFQQQGIDINDNQSIKTTKFYEPWKRSTLIMIIRFDTIPQLIDYYTIHRLPLNGCEHMALLYPIDVQLL
ncbi:hypothetical protein DERP_005046 [Dermatophagoides pteronyssinus]|uniref:SH2 domain-containing protein n=1 Tax=Dermatophagoides pteronyssinus TaxID=6956 RepID=A0ABQ8JTB1_DERPT|nr:hypothetical protein DERP_005046 [Dermatophagoides pteronyssinus]